MSEVKMLEGNSKNMPFNAGVYPNSENITPPVKKVSKRVVDPATRTQLMLDSVKAFHKQQELKAMLNLNTRLEAYLDKTYEQGKIIDIEVN